MKGFFKKTLTAVLLAAAMISFNACKDDDKKADKPAEGILKDLAGSYVELFSDKGFSGEKMQPYWVECCKPYSGDNQAQQTATYLQTVMQGRLYGAEALAAYTPENYQFNCFFINGVSLIKVDGSRISGYNGSKEVFSHTYSYVKEVKDKTFEMDFSVYKSDDENSGEFTYFFFAGDTPATTYHIEFRYGKNEEELLKMLDGSYAYWLAAGMLENESEEHVKACIKLFCDENLGKKE